jgi:membrane protein DedA with SNARE-associated domain
MADPATFLTELALQYGYLGIFATALLGSVIPFLPIPYLIAVVLLSNVLNPLVLGIAAGLGGAVGKTTSYFLGRSGYLLSKERTRKNMDTLRSLAGKYGDLAVFIFAATPLPDDICFVPIGVVRFPFWRFLLANTAGKLVLAIAVAYLGRAYFVFATVFLQESTTVATIAIMVVTVVMTILLLRVDWEKLAKNTFGRRQITESPK